MRNLMAVGSMWCLLIAVTSLHAQQIDVAFGGGSLVAPTTSTTFSGSTASLNGGAYVGFSGDVLIKRNLGAEAEVFWRASRVRTPVNRTGRFSGPSTASMLRASTSASGRRFSQESVRKAFDCIKAPSTVTYTAIARTV